MHNVFSDMVHVLFLCNVCAGSCPAVVEKAWTCGVETELSLSHRLSGFYHHLAWLDGRGASPWQRANTRGAMLKPRGLGETAGQLRHWAAGSTYLQLHKTTSCTCTT